MIQFVHIFQATSKINLCYKNVKFIFESSCSEFNMWCSTSCIIDIKFIGTYKLRYFPILRWIFTALLDIQPVASDVIWMRKQVSVYIFSHTSLKGYLNIHSVDLDFFIETISYLSFLTHVTFPLAATKLVVNVGLSLWYDPFGGGWMGNP